MCLIVVGLGATPRYPLIVAANRDEQHARPTMSAAWWTEPPGVFGGRDLLAGGTWLAVDRRGRFAAVTNIRDPDSRGKPRSRGALVAGFVAGADSAERYAASAVRAGAEFGPFNLLVYDGRELHFASNRAAAAPLGAALHAFSNGPAGTEWPKAATARAGVERLLDAPAPAAPLIETLFALLAERDESGPPEQRYRHAHFVVSPAYGTRCSTVVLIDDQGRLAFAERSFDSAGELVGEVRESFELAR
jgi:uncharacterized protein with NRDE domain